MSDQQNRDSKRILLRLCVAVVTGFTLVIVHSSQAQVSTTIISDASVGTVVNQKGNVRDITGGSRPGDGPNLFQSFGQFSVGAGGIANFLNDSGLPTENIVSRVTGGDPSQIFGTIQTTNFGNANLFLLNPAGVVFGPTASLNVGGSFHGTTADVVELGDQGVFFAKVDEASVLTMGSPETFGFLSGNPGSITIDQSTLEVPSEETLSLVGGHIGITGGRLTAPNGQITLASLSSEGTVDISQGSVPQINAFQLGEIELSDSTSIIADGEGGGTLFIRGGQLMAEGSQISANTTGLSGGTLRSELGGVGIHIQVSQNVLVNGSILEANVLDGSRNGNGITVKAGKKIEISNFSFVQTQALAGSGNAGDIRVEADTVLLSQFASVQSTASPFSTGSTGNIFLSANGLKLEGVAAIATPTFGTGRSGNIQVSVEEGDVVLSNGLITANAFGEGDAGNIQLTAKNWQLADFSTIQSSSAGLGNPGNVTLKLDGNLDIRNGASIEATSANTPGGEMSITAQDIFITGISDSMDPRGGADFTGLTTVTEAGQGGDINISADNLHVDDKGLISSATRGSGDAGSINIDLRDNLFLSNQGGILSDSRDVGDGGNINVGSRQISLTQNAFITAESNSTGDDAGNAGNINLTAADVILLDEAMVTTEAAQASGGNIDLQAEKLIRLNDSTIASSVQGDVTTVGGNISLDPEFIILENSQILAKAVEGQGGNISLVATNAILVDPLSVLDASSAFGVSGSVDIQAPIQNLSGTIAPLPEETTPVTGLYGARCAAGQGGNFSTFVDSKVDSFSPTPGRFLASPLLSHLAKEAELVTTSAGPKSQVILTASIAPLVLGYTGQPPTACP